MRITTRRALAGPLIALAAAGCDSGTPQPDAAPAATTLEIRAAQRADLRVVGADTLSDTARVRSIAVEPDGEAVAFVFADAGRGIGAGLGLSRAGEDAAQLVWPDSVSAAWWPRPHTLAFVTTRGTRIVVDVHAERLQVIEDSAASGPGGPPAPPAAPERARARAVTYVDSVRVQPAGQPQGTALRYEVASVIPAPSQPLAAFHVLATDGAGGRSNPAWFAVDTASGAVARIDEVVGPPDELPLEAGGWTSDGRFVYAKGFTLWSAEVVRRAP